MRVCIIAEGSYPVVRGGLSEWAHLLIKTLKDVEFSVLCVTPTGEEEQLYEKLPNVNEVAIRPLIRNQAFRKTSSLPEVVSMNLADSLGNILNGECLDCESIVEIRKRYPIEKWWLTSRAYWDYVVGFYEKNCPERPFLNYFWTNFGIYSILLDSLHFIDQLPRADVYHCLSVGLAGFIGSLAKILHGSPLVITEQGLYVKERRSELSGRDVSEYERQQLIKFSESLTKTSYEYADCIVPPCRSHILVEQELGADLDKIKVIDNGIECDKFRPGPERNETPLVVGCLARVVPIKGITTLIRAARIVLEKQQANFVVVGEVQDEEYYHQCQELVDELGLEDHFRFIGHANSLEWYHRIDIFVLSSLSEGVPYSLLEAMSCGLPGVCTAVGGVPEILSNPSVGYVVPPNDPDSLAEKIGELLENEPLRKRMGQQAKALANDKYTIKKMANEFYRLYEGLLNGNSKL